MNAPAGPSERIPGRTSDHLHPLVHIAAAAADVVRCRGLVAVRRRRLYRPRSRHVIDQPPGVRRDD